MARAEVLDSLVSFANETRKEHQAAITLEVQPPPAAVARDKAFVILGHDTRLGQVVRNLIDNARSFAPAQSTIRVRVRRLQYYVEFRVEDEGPGIPPENLERIFERFYTDRGDSAAAFGQNSGLGLAISKQIVEAHRGTIAAENRTEPSSDPTAPPRVLGARFIIRIPAA